MGSWSLGQPLEGKQAQMCTGQGRGGTDSEAISSRSHKGGGGGRAKWRTPRRVNCQGPTGHEQCPNTAGLRPGETVPLTWHPAGLAPAPPSFRGQGLFHGLEANRIFLEMEQAWPVSLSWLILKTVTSCNHILGAGRYCSCPCFCLRSGCPLYLQCPFPQPSQV